MRHYKASTILNKLMKELKKKYKIKEIDTWDSYGNAYTEFHIKNTRGFRFGIWYQEGELSIFTQPELFLDKFKPSRSPLCIKLEIPTDKKEPFEEYDILYIITFIESIRKNKTKAKVIDYYCMFEIKDSLKINLRKKLNVLIKVPLKTYFEAFKRYKIDALIISTRIKKKLSKLKIKHYTLKDGDSPGSRSYPRFTILLHKIEDCSKFDDAFDIENAYIKYKRKSKRRKK